MERIQIPEEEKTVHLFLPQAEAERAHVGELRSCREKLRPTGNWRTQSLRERRSLHDRRGERLALVGVHRAGKSTLIKLHCGPFQKPAHCRGEYKLRTTTSNPTYFRSRRTIQ